VFLYPVPPPFSSLAPRSFFKLCDGWHPPGHNFLLSLLAPPFPPSLPPSVFVRPAPVKVVLAGSEDSSAKTCRRPLFFVRVSIPFCSLLSANPTGDLSAVPHLPSHHSWPPFTSGRGKANGFFFSLVTIAAPFGGQLLQPPRLIEFPRDSPLPQSQLVRSGNLVVKAFSGPLGPSFVFFLTLQVPPPSYELPAPINISPPPNLPLFNLREGCFSQLLPSLASHVVTTNLGGVGSLIHTGFP